MQKKKFRKEFEYSFNLALKWKNVTLDEMKAFIGLIINMAIDESTVGYKGKISFKTYNPQKPRKWGLRVYVAAESKIVLSLFKNIRIKYPELKGMHIYTDRFYTNAPLAQELSLFKCHLTGTINPGRKGNCKEIKKPKISKGETLAYRENNILLLSWKDKRIVTMCSSWHDSSVETIERHTKQGLEQIKKTIVVSDYTQNMGGVDIADQFHLFFSKKIFEVGSTHETEPKAEIESESDLKVSDVMDEPSENEVIIPRRGRPMYIRTGKSSSADY
ncbi:hypothetical protein LAZ67_3005190 [Cordylochernes scorpioides]|uniref:PiggyBac transposable element-derived protein domain-containing protein n=1 Tax=Cordylochernes scorpioides TaxID=51811 RepID=A0ABY6KAY0_9ARAC|nr:hypothetical protein LAZ67_3005190 [Cordylochernes scorpioides]